MEPEECATRISLEGRGMLVFPDLSCVIREWMVSIWRGSCTS